MENDIFNTSPKPDSEGSINQHPDDKGCTITVFDYSHTPDKYNLLSMGKDTITFGRDDTNDIIISSELVSRKHGYFTITPNGECIINDSHSTNGTYVNNKLTERKTLKDGDLIRIDDVENSVVGGVTMIFSSVVSGADWQKYEITKPVTTIGRDKNCDIVIDHSGAHSVHAEIQHIDGRYMLVRRSEKNDILINNSPMEGQSYQLRDEDLFAIANTKLSFSSDELGNVIRYRKERFGYSLELEHIAKFVKDEKLFKPDKKILDDTSLLIEPGEFVAIVGGSGCGKSTLMNCINGFDEPDPGEVYVNRRNLYENYDELKRYIGYVPQQDIVHENLSLISMLRYVAKLRLPEDTTKEKIEERVSEVISMVELVGSEKKLIRKLSGGQKKRASIAVELLSNPGLFFLDEPSSGLDPGTERKLMHTLKRMSDSGKTVVMITHNTNNIHLCDKIIFLGKCGYMAFFGNPEDAHSFFGIPKGQDLTDAYSKVDEDPEGWEKRFKASPYNNTNKMGEAKSVDIGDDKKRKKKRRRKTKISSDKSFFHQFKVLSQRYINLIWNDKMRLLFLLLQGPLIAYLFSFVTVENTFKSYFDAQSMLFCLSCAGIWVGLMNSIQEVCKERNIVRREYMSDVRLSAYVCSKLGVQALLAFLQCSLMMFVFASTIGLPDKGVILGNAFPEMLITLFLVTLSSSALGLVVSSLVKNTDRAMVFAPVILIPQLLFSGILFKLQGATEVLSWICVSRWGMQAFSNTADLNGVLRNSLSLKYSSEDLVQQAFELNRNSIYHHSVGNLLLTWGIVMFTIVAFGFISALVLRRVKNDKR